MGSVIQLKNKVNNAYLDLKNSVDDKIILVEEKIKNKLISDVSLVEKMTSYNLETGGKKLRAMLTLSSSKLCGYLKGGRDINLAACVELIHAATLMHDDVLDNGEIRRGKVGAILGNKDEKVKEALSSYGKNLGVTFQIADDTLDYNSDLKKFGKTIGKDFYEGKITLPIIILNQQCKSGERDMLKEFFSKIERTENDLKYTLDIIKKYDIIKQCYKKADHFISLASSSLNVFESSEQKNILKNLTSFSIERSF